MIENKMDGEIKRKFSILNEQLSSEEKKAYHFSSVRNFVHHIFTTNEMVENKKLLVIHLNKKKILLIEYMDLILEEKVSIDDSIFLFKKYIENIGLFMSLNYGFSFSGGKSRFLTFLIFGGTGLTLDVIFYYLFSLNYFLLTFSLLLFAALKINRKRRDFKVYGLYY